MANDQADDLESVDDLLARMGASEHIPDGVQQAYIGFLEQLGYEPPPNQVILPDSSEDGHRPAAEISPHTKSLMLSKPFRLIRNLDDVDPAHLFFDPFVGESAPRTFHTNKSLARILEGESYVQSVSQSIRSAAETVSAASEEMKCMETSAQDLDRNLGTKERLLQQNLEHAQNKLSDLATTANQDPAAGSRRANLIDLYSLDEAVALNNLGLVKTFRAFNELDRAISNFSTWVGDAADRVNLSRVTAQHRGRRNRRRLRRFKFAGASFGLPGLTLLLDQAIASVWAFAGSAALAFCMIGVNRVVSRRLRDRWVRSQLLSLKEAIRESGKIVEQLKIRELQFNSLRSIYSLEPLTLVPPELLDPPLLDI